MSIKNKHVSISWVIIQIMIKSDMNGKTLVPVDGYSSFHTRNQLLNIHKLYSRYRFSRVTSYRNIHSARTESNLS